MKKSEIKVGGVYFAKVNNKLVRVRVDEIVVETRYAGRNGTYYHITNLTTKRQTTFRSAAKFRQEVVTS